MAPLFLIIILIATHSLVQGAAFGPSLDKRSADELSALVAELLLPGAKQFTGRLSNNDFTSAVDVAKREITESDPLLVDTTSGGYVGQYEDIATRNVTGRRRTTTFYGIRYGEAARFQAATQASYNSTPQYANAHSKACYQIDLTGLLPELVYSNMAEDCLTLNIYVPDDLIQSTEQRPVMVWVHPGGLQHEAAFTYNASQLALQGDVIVVTIQYRLSVMGFFDLKNSGSSSNNGLRDILVALKWVQNNINKFSGDPTDVTIFGQSGGSIAISLLVASPLSTGLFRRAIAMSGDHNTMGVQHCSKLHYHSVVVIKALDCLPSTPGGPDEWLKCAQAATPEAIIETQPTDIYELWENRFDLAFIPCYGDDVLPQHPTKIYKSGKSQKVDLVMGVTNHDGAFALPFTYYQVPTDEELLISEVEKITATFYRDATLTAQKGIVDFYNDSAKYDLTDPFRYSKMLLDIHSDRMILGIYQTLAYHSLHHGNSYFYNNKYNWVPRSYDFVVGVHGQDLSILFGNFLNEDALEYALATQDLLDLVTVTQKAWSNFGKTGDPNQIESANDAQWPVCGVTASNFYAGWYMEFSRDVVQGVAGTVALNHLRTEKVMKFWLEDLPALENISEI